MGPAPRPPKDLPRLPSTAGSSGSLSWVSSFVASFGSLSLLLLSLLSRLLECFRWCRWLPSSSFFLSRDLERGRGCPRRASTRVFFVGADSFFLKTSSPQFAMTTASRGRSESSTLSASIFLTTSMPETTCPKSVCFPVR